jgi:hypothetical protein
MATVSPPLRDPRDFSLVLGGPLFQLYRLLHLAGQALEFTTRRTLVVTLVAWTPLFVISLLEGTAWTGVGQPFLLDIDANARLLIALPLLVGGELFVHQRMRLTVGAFLNRGIVTGAALAKFEAAENSALRARDSRAAEILLLVFVYAIGVAVIWNQLAELDADTWYHRASGNTIHTTTAGWWYQWISLPLFQFILFRWYYRLGIWALFLWRVSRCGLKLVPTHPDRSAGLGFLGAFSYALVPFLMAHGTLFAGVIGVGIFFGGRTLVSYWPTLAAFSAFVVVISLGSLVVFAVPLARAKRIGLAEYGSLAQRYVADFDGKWVHAGSPRDQTLLGSADIQSLADMANSYHVIPTIRLIPISPQIALRLIIITLSPMAPLLLTVIPARELVSMLLKGLF